MENKKLKFFIILLIILLIMTVGGYYLYKNIKKKSDKEGNSKTLNYEIAYSDEELSAQISDYTAKIVLSDEEVSIEGNGVTNSENIVKITEAGSYYITGNSSDLSIEIEATKNDDVQLVLDNCNITSKSTAVINGIKANKITVTLADNSENILTDSSTYTSFTDTEKSEPDACIFSKKDLVINGNGKITINANYQDGIASKDGLKVINAEIEITSKDDAIRGRDYVGINGANIKINATGKGIMSTNDDEESLGYIIVDSGNIDISKSYEGMEAYYIKINNGDISIVSSDDGINICGGNSEFGMDMGGRMDFNNRKSTTRKF